VCGAIREEREREREREREETEEIVFWFCYQCNLFVSSRVKEMAESEISCEIKEIYEERGGGERECGFENRVERERRKKKGKKRAQERERECVCEKKKIFLREKREREREREREGICVCVCEKSDR
jgi:hypothetical protein